MPTATEILARRQARSIDMADAARTGGIVDAATFDTVTGAEAAIEDASPRVPGVRPLAAHHDDERFWLVGRIVAANTTFIGVRFLRSDGRIGLGVALRPEGLRVPLKAFQSSPLTDYTAKKLIDQEVLLRSENGIYHVTVLAVHAETLSVRLHDTTRCRAETAELRRANLTIPLLPFTARV